MALRARLRGGRRVTRAFAKMPRKIRKALERELLRVGRRARSAMRREFGGRLSDENRRRRDGSPRLGTWSGHAKRSIEVRKKFEPRRRHPIYKVFIGPRGGAGIPGPGFYLAFHEFGLGAFPTRAVARRARAKVYKRLLRQVRRAVERAVRLSR